MPLGRNINAVIEKDECYFGESWMLFWKI